MISLLLSRSLSRLWTASRAYDYLPVNGGASTYLGLKDVHAQEKGGRTDPRVGQAGRPGLTDPGPSWHGSVALHSRAFKLEVLLA
jgi:hypothetical protein